MGKTATGETKYKGVRLRKWGKYVSEIRLPNSRERIWLGSYDTAQKAARAFDAAQFCLRGLDAKFNFPDDPPRIEGGGQGRLPPAEIQSLAQQYGNSYAAGSGGPPARELVALEDHTSNSEGVGRRMGSNDDWSFLDMLDDNNNSSYNHDFGLFHEPGDMCMPPHYHDSHLDDQDINTTSSSSSYNYDHGNGQSFLWNF